MTADELLDFPLEKIGLNEQFIRQCSIMGFVTLRGIMDTNPEELVNKPGFSYHWLQELSTFLSKFELLNLLQPIGGKSYG